MMFTQPQRARRAFTLLEMSIVLGIIALIAGAGMTMASGSITAANRIQTQERLKTIKMALDSYAKTYGYLPCPADRSLLPGNASFGVEQRNGSTSCNANPPGLVNWSAGTVWYGGVPVRSLGLPDSYAGDSWGGKLTYAVSGSMLSDPSSYANNAGGIQVLDGTLSYNQHTKYMAPTYASSNNGSAKVRLTAASAAATGANVTVVGSTYTGSYSATNISGTVTDLTSLAYTANDNGTMYYQDFASAAAAYVVVSHGPDGRGAFPMNGTAIPTGNACNDSATAYSSPKPCTDNTQTTCRDIKNCTASGGQFVDTDYNDGTIAAQYFDDFIVWGTNTQSIAAKASVTLYTACPVGVCESWCATCSTNYPGGGSTVPPAGLTNPFVYKKVLVGGSATCTAMCFWGGLSGSVQVKAP